MAKKLKSRDHAYYGWIPDIPDHRDLLFSPSKKKPKKFPVKIDLRIDTLPVYDQGALGSCTANAISAGYAFDILKQKEVFFIPSRLFIYYNERVIEDTIDQDAGAMIRDGIKTLNTIGVCNEETWPYNLSKFADKPSDNCYKESTKNKSVKYERVNRSLNDFKNCLASGFPFAGGFSVYSSFETPEVTKTGKMSIPTADEQLLGGHAVLFMGYDDSIQCFIVRNSWGNKWGDKGYFYMPYEYLINPNLSDDFWVIQSIT